MRRNQYDEDGNPAPVPRTKEMLQAQAVIVAALEQLTDSERKRVLYAARVMLGVASDD